MKGKGRKKKGKHTQSFVAKHLALLFSPRNHQLLSTCFDVYLHNRANRTIHLNLAEHPEHLFGIWDNT